MITVTIRNHGFQVRGHANYAEPGKDIICAGMSAISETAFNVLEELIGGLHNVVCYRDEGVSEYWVMDEMEYETNIQLTTILTMLAECTKQLQRQFPEYVLLIDEYEL